MDNFLQLNDSYLNDDTNENNGIFDDVEIVIDPELEDESTVDINNYLNNFILQCRICGNMFPSKEMLDNDTECPICDSKSSNGFIFKGKLIKKNKEKEMTPEEIDAIKDLSDEDNYNDESKNIFTSGEFSKYRKDDLTDNYNDIPDE